MVSKRKSGSGERSDKKRRGEKTDTADDPGSLQFEDEFGDVLDSDGSWSDASDSEASGHSGSDKDEDEDDSLGDTGDARRVVWRPGVDPIEEDEQLDYDPAAYEMLHRMNAEWPCLSVDIVRDGLGEGRTRFPMTTYVVGGTQADRRDRNRLLVLKMSSLHRTRHDGGGDSDDSDAEGGRAGIDLGKDDDDDDADADDEDLDDDPVLEHRAIRHDGAVNRVRAMPQHPNIVSTWSESGKVHVWDITGPLASLGYTPRDAAVTGPVEGAEARARAAQRGGGADQLKPIYTFGGHPEEGFAMDWSPVTAGRLATGDCSRHIYTWDPREGGEWAVNLTPYAGHEASVEDIQWSPTEECVFASCSVDRSIRIWDSRQRGKAALCAEGAHGDDINVISWSRVVTFLLASGCDDGSFKVWDLRKFGAGGGKPSSSSSSAAAFSHPAVTGHFKWHTTPISSIEWHPTDGSALVASSSDQITVWDLSVEPDDEDEAFARESEVGFEGVDVPPQLLFVHQGQQDIKEARWHPQLADVLVSTAADGLNVFKTIAGTEEAERMRKDRDARLMDTDAEAGKSLSSKAQQQGASGSSSSSAADGKKGKKKKDKKKSKK